jgi:hypothetical protein
MKQAIRERIDASRNPERRRSRCSPKSRRLRSYPPNPFRHGDRVLMPSVDMTAGTVRAVDGDKITIRWDDGIESETAWWDVILHQPEDTSRP